MRLGKHKRIKVVDDSIFRITDVVVIVLVSVIK